ncbi:MAG: M56 family metallopeptidase [Bryobacteraceae bacterium]
MNAVFVESSVRVVLMAAGTAAVLRLLGIRNAAAQHLVWTTVLAFMLLMPAWTAWGPKVALPVLPQGEQNALEPIPMGGGILPPPPEAAVSMVAGSQGGTGPATPKPAPSWPWGRVAVGCYLAGAGVMLARLIAGTVRAGVLVRRATAGDGVFTSPECAAPVTLGWLRPVIVLPPDWRSWSAARLDAVLVHEGEHVRRRDPVVQWLALLNRAVFWFHPLAWWLERKLAALAEDACDAAVLGRQHDPRLYAGYLIDMARAVKRAGARLPAWGTAISDGGLSARIRRILEGSPPQRLSRRRATAAVVLCGSAVAIFGGCNLQRAQRPAPGQLSMNEMAKRDAAAREKQVAERQSLLDEARSMTSEEAAAKVSALKANAQDQRTYFQLMRYYEFHPDQKGKDALILWYIEHEPGGKLWPGNINPGSNHAGYERGKRLWLANLKKPGASAEIFQRAASFLQGADKPLAEDILLAGRKDYPGDPRWGRLLGEHYAMVLLGNAEPRTEFNVIRSFSVAEAQGPYARSVRAKLEQSTDSQILAQTAQWLMVWGRSRDGRIPGDTLALAESYASRAVALDPASEAAKSIHFGVVRMREMHKLKELQELPAERQKQLGDADRLRLIRFKMNEAWGPTGQNPNLDLAAARARELLDLARSTSVAPHSGYAVFEANIMLGKVALRRGHKREAARYLLAAADAPPSDELRYGPMAMNLPRALIDWGERDAAAQFLERVAPKTVRAKEFHDWAEQIRKGVNPDMRPIVIGCGQEPC